GRAWGRRKLCAAVSPGKSIEGAVAGSLCGVLAAVWIWHVYAGLTILSSVLIAVALVLTAILGDLAESAVKRAVGVKDSGRMLPGHGGLLDRIDALVPAVAVAGVLFMMLYAYRGGAAL
ncbi:MAG: phosphatidate cytidylyltransferase, partial [Mariprofundaceae bacterium]|nr:phosphatidate cytidylyltransferase [Mariprofundaceae bacterium]